MTVIVQIGRRVPRNWFKRTAKRAGGLVSFQENIWLMVQQGINLAKKKANAGGQIKFIRTKFDEKEDINFKIEWVKYMIQGTKEQEEEEYTESKDGLYKQLNKHLKKEIPESDAMKKHFKSKFLSQDKIDEAYKAGYGAMSDMTMANKLLEMGILTHIEWVKDFETREV